MPLSASTGFIREFGAWDKTIKACVRPNQHPLHALLTGNGNGNLVVR